jgi:hypothetical protein
LGKLDRTPIHIAHGDIDGVASLMLSLAITPIEAMDDQGTDLNILVRDPGLVESGNRSARAGT